MDNWFSIFLDGLRYGELTLTWSDNEEVRTVLITRVMEVDAVK
jgi:hypothetical protein